MKAIILLIVVAMIGVFAFAGVGAAQAQSTNVTATQVIGQSNTQALGQGLTKLSSVLNVVRTRLASNAVANPTGVKMSLAAISGTLISISGTMAALASRSGSVASAGSPGLPNTGGGGARFLK